MGATGGYVLRLIATPPPTSIAPATAMTTSHGPPAPIARAEPSPVAGAIRLGAGLPDGAGEITTGPVGVEGTAVPRNGVVAGVTVPLGDAAAEGVAVTVTVTVTVVVSVAVGVPGVGDGTCAEALTAPANSAAPAHSVAIVTIASLCRT